MKKMKPPTLAELAAISQIVATAATPRELDMKCQLAGVRTPNRWLAQELEYHGYCGDELVGVNMSEKARGRFDLQWLRRLEWNAEGWYSLTSFDCGFRKGGAR